MDNTFIVNDPMNDFKHDFDFSGIHYYRVPSWAKDVCWLIWTADKRTTVKWGEFYNEQDESTYFKEYDDVRVYVKAMIELEQNPYDENVIWLKFFEVSPEFQGKGFSKVMIDSLISVFKDKYAGKILQRSRASDDGVLKLKDNLSNSLDAANVSYTFSE